MKSLKVLIVEDEVIIGEHIRSLLTNCGYEVIGHAMDTKQALELFTKNKPDLVLLDINLSDGQDGITLSSMLNMVQPVPHIYLTAQSDSATIQKAASTEPIAYITKPFEDKQLMASIEIAITKFERLSQPQESSNDNNFFFVKDGYSFVKIKAENIAYIKSDKNYLDIYEVTDNKFSMRSSLKEFLDKLPEGNFVQTHRSYIVNLEHVKKMDMDYIYLLQTKIPIGHSYKEDVLNRLPKF